MTDAAILHRRTTFWGSILLTFATSSLSVHCYCSPSPKQRRPTRITASSTSATRFVENVIPLLSSSQGDRSKDSIFSPAAKWHKSRRRQMLQKYGDEILPLERDSSSHTLALSLLFLSNASLFALSVLSGRLHPIQVALLALFPGSIFSLWTLQILHDGLHGSLLNKKQQNFFGVKRRDLQNSILFWGSMPSAFGYYLYLKYGHLTHHKSLGDAHSASLKQLFESDQKDFEDGDVLFVSHRMKLKGEVGPTFKFGEKSVTLSISKMGFNSWKESRSIRNAFAFAASFMYERFMLIINDFVVAITGRNYFFKNKPQQFHDECARYCRCAVMVRGLLWKLAGWKSLLFLYLSGENVRVHGVEVKRPAMSRNVGFIILFLALTDLGLNHLASFFLNQKHCGLSPPILRVPCL